MTTRTTTTSPYLTQLPDYISFAQCPPRQQASHRLHGLYADFSRRCDDGRGGQGEANLRANVAWWSETLREMVWTGHQGSGGQHKPDAEAATQGRDTQAAGGLCADRLVLHVNDALRSDLAWPGVGRPAGLASVVVRMPILSHLLSWHDAQCIR